MKKIALVLAAVAMSAVVYAQVGGDPVPVEATDPNVKQVEVVNFPDPQSVSGAVEVSNLPAVQQVEVVNPGSGIQSVVTDLLDTPLELGSGVTWISDTFDTDAFTRAGLRVAGDSGLYCEIRWQWIDGDTFVASWTTGREAGGDRAACAPSSEVGPCLAFGPVDGVRAHVGCFNFYPIGTLENVKVLLRRE